MPQNVCPDRNANNIGLLRLVLASCVIIGHSPEIIDGSWARDPLHRVFGTFWMGGLGVDGFFVLSGFLITGSMLSPGVTLGGFLRRRVLRIVPGYAVAYLLSWFLLGSLVGVHVLRDLPETFLHLMFLSYPPMHPDVFPDLHWHMLNGPMWTISYEFRCYVLVGLMGTAGLLGYRRVLLGATAALLLAYMAARYPGVAWRIRSVSVESVNLVVGSIDNDLRFMGAFMVGCCIRLYREEFLALTARPSVVAGASLLLMLALFFDPVAELALVVLGSVPLFWFAFHARLGRVGQVNARTDISYGVYLYGWPIGITLVWLVPHVSPVVLAIVTLGIAALFGAASWHGVERWFKPAEQARRKHELPRTDGERGELFPA